MGKTGQAILKALPRICLSNQMTNKAKKILTRRAQNPDLIFVCLLIITCLILLRLPTGFEERRPPDSRVAKGMIISVDNEDMTRNLMVKTGSQTLNIKLLEGPFEGRSLNALNLLYGKMDMDEIYEPGRVILVEYSVKDGKIKGVRPRGTYRLGLEMLLVILFAVLLTVVAGWTGLKALLSFIFSALMLWKVMIPAFLKGADPILAGLGVVALLTASISFLVGGISRKGSVCFLGAFSGLILTCILAQLFMKGFRIHGATRPFAETLLYSGFYYLNLTRIFLAGVFIASSGAVMDLAMDISASMHEIIQKHPLISKWEHFRSGMAVGRAVIGTMTTTLLLAYLGSYMTMMMVFMGQGVPVSNILNINYVAAEILNIMVGSFGLVAVAPLTAFIGAVIYGKRS